MVRGTLAIQGGEAAAILGDLELGEKAQHIYESRRLRSAYFQDDIFSDPAWDLLLSLYVAGTTGTRVSVSVACASAAVPTTTALRWIQVLIRNGLAVKIADAEDKRRVWLRLTPGAVERMEAYLAAL